MNMQNEKLTSTGLLVLRVGVGLFMLVHGWAKLSGFAEAQNHFPDPIGMGSKLSLIMAIGAEVGCSALLILGLATRLASIPLAFTMVIALFVVHGEDPWKVKELAGMYLLVYVSLMLTGPGIFSLDHLFFRRDTAPAGLESPT
ncbi:putative oxidoreductase [Neorhodopirellula lusitana]|uniref:Oxidoreductase n=1 Tax=Neorhodopirellula lusitana TaxID=445327 RepID=A0ABY1QJN5_9BACT|nr:DoxX family protein [Neorhodopirellula lusitana]SMP73416.1 putative oxidoreductase [Neorhodopirellula lusitana]